MFKNLIGKRRALFGLTLRVVLLGTSLLITQGCGAIIHAALVSMNGSSSSGNAPITVQQANLLVSRGDSDLGPTTEAKGAEVIALQLRLVSTIPSTLQELTVTASGSGDDSLIPSVKLFLDVAANGSLEQADPLLGTASFNSDDGQAVFQNLSQELSPLSPVHFIVAIGLPAGANDNDSFAVSLADSSAIQLVSDEAIAVLGAPVVGGAKTISQTGTLTVFPGPVSRDTTIAFPGTTGLSLIQLDLRASSAESVTANRLALQVSGTGNDATDIVSASLFIDVDSDGRLSPIDRPIVTGVQIPADNGTLVFDNLAQTIPASSVIRWLVVADLANNIAEGATFAISLNDNSDFGLTGVTSLQSISALGAPVTGTTLTVNLVPSSPVAVTASQESVISGNLTPNQSRATLFALRLRETGNDAARLTALTLSSSGTGNENSDIVAVTLFRDSDGNQMFSTGDIPIATGVYSGDDGRITFGRLDETIPSLGTRDFIVTYDMADGTQVRSGEIFNVELLPGDLILESAGIGQPLTPVGLPLSGATRQVPSVGAIDISVPSAITQLDLAANQREVPALAFRLTETGNDAVQLNAVTIRSSGTGQDDSDLLRVQLFNDVDSSGTVSPGDSLLSTTSFPQDNGVAIFNALNFQIQPLGRLDLLVTVDVADNNQIAQGESYSISIVPGDLNLVSQSLQAPAAQTGLPLSGPTLSVTTSILNAQRGINSPANDATVFAGSVSIPMLQLDLSAPNSGTVNVERIDIQASGSGDDSSDIDNLELYRDQNGNGLIDPGDTLIQSRATPFTIDDGIASFSNINLNIVPGSPQFLLVAYTLSASAVNGNQFTLSIPNNGIIVSTPATVSAAFPLQGRTLTIGGGRVTVSQPPTSALAFPPGASEVPMLRLRFNETDNQSVTVQSIRVNSAGSGDESSDILFATLRLDSDGDGTVSPGDIVLGGSSFTQDNGSVVFSGLTQNIPPSGTIDFLVTINTANQGQTTPGENFQFSVSPDDVKALSDSVGQEIAIAGLPQTGPLKSVQVPNFTVQDGPNNPTGNLTVFADSDNLTTLQVAMTAPTGIAVTVTGIDIRGRGTGNEANDVENLKLFRDVNGNGILDGPDTLIRTTPSPFPTDNGLASINGLNETVLGGQTVLWLVVYDLSNSPSLNSTFSSELTNAASIRVGQAATVSGNFAITGRDIVIGAGAITASQPGSVSGTIQGDQRNIPMLRLNLLETSGDAVRLDSLAITGGGSGNENTDIQSVRLHIDQDNNGVISAGDQLLGASTFLGDNGKANFLALNLTIPANGSLNLLVSYDTASSAELQSGESFFASVQVGDLNLTSISAGKSILPLGLPQTGGSRSVPAASLDVQVGPANPSGSRAVFNDDSSIVMTQFRLSATAADVSVTELDITASGSGADQDDIDNAHLYIDVNSDGLLDVGDTLIQTLSDPFGNTDNGSASFSGLSQTINAGQSQSWILVYDLNGNAANGSQFNVQITANTNVTVTAPATVSGAFPITGRSLTVGGGAITVSNAGAVGASIQGDQINVPMLRLALQETDNQAVTVTSLSLMSGGTGNSATDFLSVKLYLDANKDGFVDTGDSLLGAGQFSAGTLAFNNLSVMIASGATEELLVVVDTAANSNLAANDGFSISSTAVTANSDAVGRSITVSNQNQTGNTRTVPAANLDIQLGPNNPTGNLNLFDNDTGTVMTQFTLTASSSNDLEITQVDITASGSGADQDDIANAHLYIDVNGDGLLNPGDTLIQTLSDPYGNTDNGTASFSGLSQTINAGQSQNWILVYDLNGNAINGSQFNVQITANSNVTATAPATVSGAFPITGRSLTVGGGAITVSNAGAVGTSIQGDQINVPMLRLALQETDNQAVTVTSLSLMSGGTGNSATDFLSVKLYLDANKDGLVDTGESLLAAGQFSGGVLVFSGLNQVIGAGATEELLVAVDTAPKSQLIANQTFFVNSTALTVSSNSVQKNLVVTGPSQTGNTRTVPAANLDIQLGPKNPTAVLNVFDNDTGTVMTQFTLSASSANDVEITQVDITASGSGADQDDIDNAHLYIDVNSDGLLDPGDTLIQTLSDPYGNTDNGTASFSGLSQTINAGQSQNWILVYDLNGNAINGSQFNVQITANSNVTVTAPATVSGAFPITGRSLTVGGGAVTVSNAGAVGTSIQGDQINVPMLRLALQETDNQAVTVTSLSLMSGGTGNSATDFLSVKLYLDANKDGFVDAGDSPLSAGQFSAGTLAFNNLSVMIASGATEELLIVVDTAPNSNLGANETFFISSTAITANSSSVGRSITITNQTQTGNTRTVPAANLDIQLGPNNPTGNLNLFDNDTGTVMTQFTLTASSANDVEITQVDITSSGSGADQDDIDNAHLYIDVNGDGLLDPGDTLIQTLSDPYGNTDNGSASFSGLSQTINAGQSQSWILVYDLNGNAANGSQFNVQITANTNITVTAPATVSGAFPITGRSLTVGGGAVTVSNAGAVGASIEGDQINVPMLRLSLQETDNQAVTVTSLSLNSGGTGNSATDFLSVKLYLDANKDGLVDTGDSLLSASQFSAGSLAFNNLSVMIASGATEELLIVVDTAANSNLAANESFSISSTAVTANSNAVGRSITVSNQNQTGNTRTVPAANLDIQLGPNNPTGNLNLFDNDNGTVMTQFTLTASSSNDLEITQVDITASGSGADQNDINNAHLYIDVNGDGLLDPGDTLIQTLNDPYGNTDNGSASFTALSHTINAGQSKTWILVYDLNGNAANGSQFNVQITANTNVTVTAPATVSGAFPITGRSLTVGGGAITVSNAGAVGASIEGDQINVPMLRLALQETDNQAVTVTSLSLMSGGTGNSATDFLSVKLYLDANKDGLVDTGDALLGAGQFSGGALSIGNLMLSIGAGQTTELLVVVDTASKNQLIANQSFFISTAPNSVLAQSNQVGRGIIVSNASQTGTIRVVATPNLDFQEGPNNPTGTLSVLANETGLVMTQMTLNATTAADIVVNSIDITASGNGADQDDIANAHLYIDVNSDGLLDPGDTLIQTISDPYGNTDNGTASFSGLSQTINAGQSQNWILVYDLNGNATNGSQFNVQITANTNVTVTAPATVSGAFPLSGRSLLVSDATSSISQPTTPSNLVVPDATDLVLLHFRVSATGTDSIRMTSVSINAAGSGDDQNDVLLVKLYHDANSDGVVNVGDVQLQTGGYNADNGQVSFSGLTEVAPAMGNRDFIIAYDMANSANVSAGESFQAQLLAGNISLESVTSGLAVTPSGLPQFGPSLTVPVQEFTINAGNQNPSGALNVFDNRAGVVMFQALLSAPAALSVEITQVNIRASGSGADQDDIANAHLYIDVNGDGLLDAGDTLIQTLSDPFGNTDNGSASFSGFSQTINAGQSQNWILVYDLNGNAANGSQFSVQITANTDVTVTAPATVTGAFPIVGRSLTVGGGAVTVSRPAAVGVSLEGGQTNLPMLRLSLQETDNATVRLKTLTLTSGGTGNGATGFLAVKLYLDNNKNGAVEGTDTLLAIGQISGGTLSFVGLSQTIGSMTTEELLIVVDTAPKSSFTAGQTFQLSSSVINIESVVVGESVIVTNQSQSGTARTVPTPNLDIQLGNNNPSGNLTVFDNDTSTVMTQFTLTASSANDVQITQVDITASGSGADQDDIANAHLYIDVNGDGLLDPGDTLIQTLNDPYGNTDNGTASFTALSQTINAGQSQNWILVYDLNGNAINGSQFNVQITANTNITVTAPATVSGAFPITGRSLTVGGGAVTVSNAGAVGASIEGEQINVPMLRLSLQETDNQAVTVTSLSLNSGGTGNSATDFLSVKLYLDANKDGLVNNGESLLAAGQFSGGVLVFSGLNQVIGAGTTEELLIAVDTAPKSQLIANQTFFVNSTALTVSSNSVQKNVVVIGPSQTGNTRTVPTPNLDIQLGTNNPTGNLPRFDNDSSLVMTQMKLSASNTADITVTAVTVTASGSGADQDDIDNAHLYIDVNGDGLLDPGDTLIQTLNDPYGNTDNGTASFTALSQAINAGQSQNWILVYDLNGNAINGSQFNVQITANTNITVTAPATVSGAFPITGRSLTVGGGAVTVSNAGAVGASIEEEQINVPMLRLALQETDNQGVTVTSLSLNSGGTGNSATDFLSVKLYLDTNKDGLVNNGESLLAAGQFSGGVLVFSGLTQVIGAGATEELLIVVDTAPKSQLIANQTFSVNSTALTVSSNSVQKNVVVTGPSQTGTTRTVPTPNLDIQLGSNNPTGNLAVFKNATGIVIFQLTLSASSAADIVLDQLNIKSSGSGADQDDIANAHLYIDVNGDGLLDPGDTLIQTLSDPYGNTDNGSASFTGLNQTISAGQSENWILVYDFNGSGVNDSTYQVQVTSASDVSVTAPATVSGGFTLTGRTVTLGGGLISVTDIPVSGTTIGPDETNVVVLQLQLQETDGQAVRLSTLTLRPGGTGNPSDIAKVQLIADIDSDGMLGPDDQILGASSFGASLTLNNLNYEVPALATRSLLVTYDMKDAGLVAPGETYFPIVQSGDLVINSESVGQPVTVSGLFPFNGATRTTPARTLSVQVGAANPGASFEFNNDTDVEVLQLLLNANPAVSGAAITVTDIQFQLSGTGDDNSDLSAIKLYRDLNNNGVVDPSDGTPIATLTGAGLPADDGSANFSGLTEAIPPGEMRSWLLAYDFNGAASIAETFQATLTNASFVTVNSPATVSGSFPVNGGVKTIGGGSITLSQPSTPALNLFPKSNDSVMLHLRLAETSGDPVQFTSLTIQGTGSGDESTDIMSVVLFRDTNANGSFDSSDTSIAARAFNSDNGTVTLSGFTESIAANGSGDYFVVYITADASTLLPTESFMVTVPSSGITVLSTNVQREVMASPLPQSGVSRQVDNPILTLSEGDNNPEPAMNVAGNASGQVLLQLDLSADLSGNVTISQLDLGSSGTGDESTDVTSVELYIDSDGDGRLDPGETMIGTGSYGADNGTVSFTNLAQVIAPGESVKWIVVYNLNGNASDTETFSVQVSSGGLTVDNPATVSASFPIAGNEITIDNGNTGTALVTQPIGVSGFIGPDFKDIPLIALRLADTSAQNLRLDSLAVMASGSGNDATDFLQLKLWNDMDASGNVTPGDVQLAVTQFIQDNGRAGFAGLSSVISASGTIDVLVTGDMASDSFVQPGETFAVTVALNDISLVVDSNSSPVMVTGLPQSGPTHTVPAPSVEVTLGNNSASGAIPGVATDFPVAQFQFAPNGGADILVGELVFTGSGSGDESTTITTAKLFFDSDNDGIPDGPALKTINTPFSSDNGTIMFSAINLAIDNTKKASFIVTYSFNNNILAGSDFALSIANANDVRLLSPATVLGSFPVTGNSLVSNGALNITVLNSTDTDPRALPVSSSDEAILYLELDATLENMTINSLSLRATGTAADNLAFVNAKLYIDDGDGVFEPGLGDGAPIGTVASAFGTDNGELTFTLNQTIVTGAPQQWWFSLDTSASQSAGASFQASFATNQSATVTGQTTGSTVFTGFPAFSELFLTVNPNAIFGAASNQTLAFPTLKVEDLKTGDFNKDGRPDYVVLSENGRIEVKLGDGNGGFTAGPLGGTFPGVNTADPQRLAVGDMNRDGYPDIVVTYHERLRIFFNDGAGANTGAFSTMADYPAPSNTDLRHFVLMDVDRDGDLDTVTTIKVPFAIRIRRNNGAGVLSAPDTITTLVDPRRATLVVGDVNGDGIDDLVIGEKSSAATGNTDVIVLFTGDGNTLVRQDSVSTAGDGNFIIAGVDLTRNSFLDLVSIRDKDENLQSYFLNSNKTGFTLDSIIDSTLAKGAGIVSGDFNGDGFADLALAANEASDFAVQLGQGKLTFSATVIRKYPVKDREDRIASADFNSDGDADLLLGSSKVVNGTVSVVLGDGDNGTGDFLLQAPLVTNPLNAAPVDTAVGDFDRDGDLDIVVMLAGTPGKLRVLLNQGGGRGYLRSNEITLSGTPIRIECVDMNRDGTLDLAALVSGSFNGIEVFSGNRDGTFLGATQTSTSNNAVPSDFAFGDVNRDGTLDAVVVSSAIDAFQVFLSDGSKLLAGSNQTSTGDGPVTLVLGDMNSDGILDVVVSATNDHTIQTFIGDGNAAFTPQTSFSVPSNARPAETLAVGDINDDGQLDLVAARGTNPRVLLLDGQGTGIFNLGDSFGGGGGATTDLRLLDLDRDGDLDIVRSTASGELRVNRNDNRNTQSFNFGSSESQSIINGVAIKIAVGDMNRDGDLDIAAVCTGSNDIQFFFGE